MVKGILIGSAVGAAAAMLMTPKSGKEMRETIRCKTTEWSSAARDRASAIASSAMGKVSEVSDRVGDLSRTAVNKAASAAEQTAHLLNSKHREEEGATMHEQANGSSDERTRA